MPETSGVLAVNSAADPFMDSWVFRPGGDLQADCAGDLLDELLSWLHGGSNVGVLDLDAVQSMDSSCLAVLLAIRQEAVRSWPDKVLQLTNVQPQVRRFLMTTQFRENLLQAQECHA